MEHALRIVKCPWEWLSREPGAAAGAGKALLLKWSIKVRTRDGGHRSSLGEGGERTETKHKTRLGGVQSYFGSLGFWTEVPNPSCVRDLFPVYRSTERFRQHCAT